MEFTRWFVGVVFLSGREDEPNHPRHQPTEAPTISSTTRTPTNTSFKARRKTRRATNRKSPTATKAIRPVVIAIVMLVTVPEVLQPKTSNAALCLLRTAFGFPVARPHGRLDVSAHIKVAFDLHVDRIAGLHKVFEDHVDYVLVKNLHLAK